MNTEIILKSSLLAALISGLVSYLLANKNAKLHYITEERQKWRNNIRRISKRLQGASYTETLKLLAELKVLINAFGNSIYNKQYNRDSHIWDLIHDIEKAHCSKHLLRLKQNQLSEYLGLLLKNDWEKSKQEVKGDKFFFVSLASFCFSYFTFIAKIYKSNDNISLEILVIAIVFTLLMLLPVIFLYYEINYLCNSIITCFCNKKPYRNGIFPLALCYLICAISIIAVAWLDYYVTKKLYDINKFQYDIIFYGIIFFKILGCVFLYITKSKYIEQTFFYYRAIVELDNRYNQLMKEQHSDEKLTIQTKIKLTVHKK